MEINDIQAIKQHSLDIITVCKNDPAGLKKTLISCTSQAFENLRVIVVLPDQHDQSCHVACEFSKNYNNVQIRFQDGTGIYNAMNSGLRDVVSEFVWFMNAGDTFYNNSSVDTAIKEAIMNKASLVMGGYAIEGEAKEYVYRRREVSPLSFALNRRWGCHQSMMFNSALLRKVLFDEKYRIAADFKSVLLLLLNNKAIRLETCLSEISPGGISHNMLSKTIKEKQQIRIEIFGKFSWIVILGFFWSLGVNLKMNVRKKVFH